jgi:hypothetical protein
MMSPKTDFETHTYKQGYGEEHWRPVKAVTHLFEVGHLDVGHHKVKASAVKELVARKKPHGDCESSLAQEAWCTCGWIKRNAYQPYSKAICIP